MLPHPHEFAVYLFFFPSPIIKAITTYLIIIFFIKVYAILQPIRIVIKPRIDVMNIFQLIFVEKHGFELRPSNLISNIRIVIQNLSLTKESLTLFLAHFVLNYHNLL